MKITLKKLLSLLFALVITVSCFGTVLSVFGDDGVIINETNFPDATWRKIVEREFDTQKDGVLSAQERSVSAMIISGYIEDLALDEGRNPEDYEINDLKGIENFTSLKVLRCNYIGNLSSLDVSKLTQLTVLDCSANDIAAIDLSQNTKLIELHCSSNDAIKTLDLSANTALEKVHCYANLNLTSLNLSGLTALTDLKCDQDALTRLDLSTNMALKTLNCSHNCLSTLDLSSNTALTDITDYKIGSQVVTATAVYSGGVVRVPLYSIKDTSRVLSSSLDKDGVSAFVNNGFETDTKENIENGIDYIYSTGLEGAADLSVHVNTQRIFYQVDFYTAEDKSVKLGSVYVNEGEAAPDPQMPAAPQCKAFDRWSRDTSSVNADMEVYIIWKDAHSYSLTAFENDIATIKCKSCNNSYTVAFIDCVNSKPGDSNYEPHLDVVKDNFINAKDYSKLIKDFKKPADDNDVTWGN